MLKIINPCGRVHLKGKGFDYIVVVDECWVAQIKLLTEMAVTINSFPLFSWSHVLSIKKKNKVFSSTKFQAFKIYYLLDPIWYWNPGLSPRSFYYMGTCTKINKSQFRLLICEKIWVNLWDDKFEVLCTSKLLANMVYLP
jgi:hypothetical protein